MPLFVKNHPTQPCCFLVESVSSPGRPHTVDLLENDGAAVCTCTDWSTRRSPALRDGHLPYTEATTCKHIRAATAHFLREILPAISAQQQTPRRAQDKTPTQRPPVSSANDAHSLRTANGSLDSSFRKPTLAAQPAAQFPTTSSPSKVPAARR